MSVFVVLTSQDHFNNDYKALLRGSNLQTKMNKILGKTLRDSIKEDRCTIGTKQVLNSIKNSKLIVLSKSISEDVLSKIHEAAKKEKVPTVEFKGTSVELGRLCGLQFRVSAVSFNSLADTNIQSIINEGKE